MSQYTSYYLYQKYEKRGEQDWIPVYPNSYSISGDSANPMPLSIKDENDPTCGYVPVVVPIYEWRNMDITTNYVCGDCDEYKASGTDYWGYFYSNLCDGNPSISGVTYTGPGTVPPNVWAKTIKIGTCITSIADNSFSGYTSLESVEMPSTITSIGNEAFCGDESLYDCSLPNSITSIGIKAFSGCTSLEVINLPNNVTSLGSSAFTNCLSITDMNIPSGLTSIPDSCFYNCDALHTFEIPSTVTSIGNSAFRYCSGLFSVTVRSTTPPTLGTNVFDNVGSYFQIYVPASAVNTYKSATNWSTYANKIQPIT